MNKSHKDNTSISDENTVFSMAILSVIGDREEQQDCFGYSLQAEEGIVAICDGMGGHAGGQKASNTAISHLIGNYDNNYPVLAPDVFLRAETDTIDSEIKAFLTDDGVNLNAGTTLVCVFIRDKQLYWMSVGDSRLYLYRSGQLVQVTQDHVYQIVLDGLLEKGEITQLEYVREEVKGEALISYLGIGNLQLVDNNTTPFTLKSGDKLLLMSDGLYKSVPDSEIKTILENFTNSSDALQALNLKAEKNAKKTFLNRDNTTVSLLQIK